jgi:hypothetical protein
VEVRILNGLQELPSEVLLIKGLRADNIGQKPVKRRIGSYLRKIKDLSANRVNGYLSRQKKRAQETEIKTQNCTRRL